jgi:hypothetical protein
MSVLARATHQHQNDTERIQTLKRQLNASRTNFVKVYSKMTLFSKSCCT